MQVSLIFDVHVDRIPSSSGVTRPLALDVDVTRVCQTRRRCSTTARLAGRALAGPHRVTTQGKQHLRRTIAVII